MSFAVSENSIISQFPRQIVMTNRITICGWV